MEANGPWISVTERVDPQVTSYTVVGLKPFITYRFRIQATNDIGPSGWSPESMQVRTLPAGSNGDEIFLLLRGLGNNIIV